MTKLPAAGAKRFGFLDICRALAAISVMFQHSMEGAGLLPLTRDGFGQTVINFGEVGVVIFFLVSGYIIPKSLESVKDLTVFWIRRALRIYPLYFVIMFATLGVHLFLMKGPLPNPLKLLPHLLFAQAWIGFPDFVGGSWTLFIELIWYIVFAGLFWLGMNKKHKAVFYPPILVLVALLSVAGLSHIAHASHIAHIPEIRIPLGRISLLVICFLGLLWLRYHDGAVTKQFFYTMLGIYIAVIFSALLVGFGLSRGAKDHSPDVVCVIVSWSFGLSVFAACYFLRAQSGWLQYLGVISYSVYLIHSLTIVTLHALGMSGPLMVAAVFVISIAVAALTYRFVEDPFIEYSKRFKHVPKTETQADTKAVAAADIVAVTPDPAVVADKVAPGEGPAQ